MDNIPRTRFNKTNIKIKMENLYFYYIKLLFNIKSANKFNPGAIN